MNWQIYGDKWTMNKDENNMKHNNDMYTEILKQWQLKAMKGVEMTMGAMNAMETN